MPRLLLALVACLLAFGPQRVCACEADRCFDSACPLADDNVGCGHHHDGDEDERAPDEHRGHKHHERDCPAVTAAPAPVFCSPHVVAVDDSVGFASALPADVVSRTLGKPFRTDSPPTFTPHVPLHVSLQVFRI